MPRVLPIWFLLVAWFGVPGFIFTARAQVANVPPVDTTDRTGVVDLYRHYYLPDSHPFPGWTGNVGNGAPGTLNRDFVRATLRRINYYRAMSGLPGVVFDPVDNARCQQTALMMSAQNAISHTPSHDWKFYTPAAADTALHANLDLNHHGDMGPGAIDRYISDFGRENGCVGHRRWLLYNAATVMGTGAVPADHSGHPGANVTYIGGPAPRRAAAAPPSAAWPPAGFVPAPLVYDRWSFAYDAADFHLATVRVTKDGAPVAAVREKVRFQMRADGTGSIVGNNTLVWTLPGNVVSHTSDETYRVQIDNVYVGGERRQFDYTVTSIDPNRGRSASAVASATPARRRTAAANEANEANDDLTTLVIAGNYSEAAAVKR